MNNSDDDEMDVEEAHTVPPLKEPPEAQAPIELLIEGEVEREVERELELRRLREQQVQIRRLRKQQE